MMPLNFKSLKLMSFLVGALGKRNQPSPGEPLEFWTCCFPDKSLVITFFLGLDNNQNKRNRLTCLPPQNIVSCILELIIKDIQIIKEMPPIDHKLSAEHRYLQNEATFGYSVDLPTEITDLFFMCTLWAISPKTGVLKFKKWYAHVK